jgi:succinate dehydrogenase / fumarate reductase cytochrome b subunit
VKITFSRRQEQGMAEVIKKKQQFRNINITQIARYRLPFAGLISILHRVSGAIMFLLLPLVLYLLELSLSSENTFGYMKGFVDNWFMKLIILALSWAFLHHFCAGIRHLAMDYHIGIDKDSSRRSAVAVFAVSLPLAALVALKLFGAI